MRKILYMAGVMIAASIVMTAPAFATSSSDHKLGICHATGSKTNPYVYIEVDTHAAEAHKHHQDGRDIIGVSSAKACPKAITSPTPSPKTTTTPQASASGQVLGASTEQPTRLPDTGAGLSTLIGLPSLAVAGRLYLRSRR